MRSFRRQLLILSIMMYSICCAQFQIVHDVPNTTTNPIIQPVILEDGGILTHQWLNNVHTLRKYDQQGGLLWSTSIPDPSLVSIEPTPSGIVFCNYLGFTATPNDTMWMEELHQHSFRITRLDMDGQIEGSDLLRKSYLTSSSNWSWISTIDIALTNDGGSVLLINFDESPMGQIDILKLTANNSLEWSRCLGNNDTAWPGLPDPTYTFNNLIRGRLNANGGEIYYTEGGEYYGSHFRLAKLDSNGDVVWMKTYEYGNTDPYVTVNDLLIDGSGKIHMDGSLQTTVGRFHIFLQASSQGDLERVDIYRTPYYLQNLQFGLDSEGRRVHRVALTTPFTGIPSHGLFIADTLGSPGQLLRRDDQIVMPNNVFIPFGGMDVHNDRIALSGLLNHEHVDLAFTTRYEALLSFDTENVFSCFMNDTMLAHIPVPLEIMTTENITNAVSLDVSAYYSVQPDTITLTSLDPEPLDTLCSFGYNLLGVEIGIAEGSLGTGIPLVKQTLVVRDRPIVLNDIGASVIEVWNTNGALIMDRNLHGELSSIPTTGWNPGMYMIRALNELGIPIRIERIMLE